MSDRWVSELCRDTAELFAGAEGSRARSLRRMTHVVARRVPGCTGASATFWDGDEVAAMAASGPDAAGLEKRQFVAGDGPIIAAMRSGKPSVSRDMTREDRWPEFAAKALAAGVRSSTAIVHGYYSMSLSLSLHGGRSALPGKEPFPLAPLLAAFGAATMASAAENVDKKRNAARLQDAMTSQVVVNQAIGVLMQLLGCDADDAFDRLQGVAQAQHMRLSEVARWVVKSQTEPDGPPEPV